MSKSEAVHEFYEQFKDLNFDDTYELIKNSESQEERDFIRVVTNFILQQKQREAIREKRF